MQLWFDFSRWKVQFLFEVVHNEAKHEYKMESDYNTIESVKLVDVTDHPTQAFLLQARK